MIAMTEATAFIVPGRLKMSEGIADAHAPQAQLTGTSPEVAETTATEMTADG